MTPEVEAEGPEYETLCSFTSRIGSDDLAFALKMNAHLNRQGLDSLSCGETIGWAMECVQRGLVSKDDLGGLDFTWGNRETVETIVDMIIHRRGVGDWFAEGTRSLAGRFGPEARELALHVKGLDVICGDPRGIKAFGLTYAIASRGGDHLRAEPFFELTNRFDEAEKRFGNRNIADRLADDGKAVLVEYTERQALLTDCLTMCKNIGLSMDVLDFEMASRLLVAGTGLKFTPERVDKCLKGVIDTDRLLNIDFGVESADDTLPKRFYQRAADRGGVQGPSGAGPGDGEGLLQAPRLGRNRKTREKQGVIAAGCRKSRIWGSGGRARGIALCGQRTGGRELRCPDEIDVGNS